MKRVIITGANGFIGTNLVKKLMSEQKLSLVLVSNTNNTNEEFFREKQKKENLPLKFHIADIRDRKIISKIFEDEKADTCIHLAAKISVADSIRNPEETMEINVNGTANVLEACHKSQTRNFIFASSAAVYGDVSELPINEDATLAPLSPYGSSKMIAEKKILQYQKTAKIHHAIILRFFNVYGQRQYNENDVVSKFADRLIHHLPPIVDGDGTQTRDFVYIDDVVDAILLSVKSIDHGFLCGEIEHPPIFNVGTGMQTSINQIAEKMIEILGLELKPIHLEQKDSKAILHSYADITRAKNALGFIAKKRMDEGLKQIVRSIKP